MPRLSRPFLLRTLTDRLLPGYCALCGGDGPGPICACCRLALMPATTLRCERCAIRLPQVAQDSHSSSSSSSSSSSCSSGRDSSGTTETTAPVSCAVCAQEQPAFDRTLALADYAPPFDRLLQDLKFRAHLPLAAAFGDLLAHAAQQQLTCAPKPDTPEIVLLPVPLSRERLAERGFNQAQEIARPLARALHLKITTDICARVRHTEAQASLPASERQVNMRGAFAVLQRQAVAGKAFWVVDDVMTTGHTLAALAACLKRHGAAHVTNLVIARTPTR